MRVLTENKAAGGTLLAVGGAALPAAPGYSRAALTDGILASVWRAPSSATQHRIVLDLGASSGCDAIAVFDLYVGALAPQVSLHVGTSASGPWVKQATLAHGGRRDHGALLPEAVWSRYWMIEITTILDSQPEVGEVWIGMSQGVPALSALSPRIAHQVEIAGSQATKLGEPRVTLSLGWQALGATDHAAVAALLAAAGGGLRPVAIWPRPARQGQVYLVRLGNSLGWSEDIDIYDGHGLEAVELERVLHG